MIVEYCKNCKTNRGFKRTLGWGTFFGGFFTGGLLLLFIPFYPKRCIVCGSNKKKMEREQTNVSVSQSGSYIGSDAWDHLRNNKEESEDTKKCPYCAETIKKAAIVCRFCNKELSRM